jgi:dihydrolipoamide dehydrogenase
MPDPKHFDVVVIGTGPGGYVAAIRAAQLGLSVLIVEKEPRLGGVCTLWGCIPTKALLHTADLLEEARHGAEVGVSAREVRLDMPAAMKHKEKIVRQSTNGISYLMKKNRVDVAAGFVRVIVVLFVRPTADYAVEVRQLCDQCLTALGGRAGLPVPVQ